MNAWSLMLWPVMAADPASVRVGQRFRWWVGTMVRPLPASWRHLSAVCSGFVGVWGLCGELHAGGQKRLP